ncbi:ACP S-malonyltransferase [Candidatus Pantoea carbekii]|uniref:Malonyl CoA-acyl carrier protein transacylase n=1 Tax=Candidatus Pantoea carbekii TaxID=1235990 RepID=U3U8I9_9GAMM|nr:ACP S-malonyltransferase [Candidatus Pantoea carbekii]AKC32133.1 malonyl CoA-acyl carrier protein transacylase [Candidatus Pantoea carbekii]BAO00659.1 malonyl CoA-acyl carrier protein transacylase [Candidatus Pantoea carbekii]
MTEFAFVFPGQGCQTIGMLAKLAAENFQIEKTFYEASDVLGYDLWRLVQKGPIEKLNKTYHTQPALLAASVSIYRIWQSKKGIVPSFMAGHSLGEYSALVCAGALNFTDAIKLVELRGEIMQEAVPEGTCTMKAIIGLDRESIQKACKKSAQDQVVCSVNFNGFDQVVIAGHNEAVNRAVQRCKAAGAKRIVPLQVSIPSHCKLMKSASNKLQVALKSIVFKKPIVPVINNVDVRCETNPEAIRSALVRQLYNPVRWTEVVEFIALQGIKHFLEIGPSKVLTGLTKRIIDTLNVASVNDPDSLTAAMTQQLEGN